ncbi:uncharacterized protein LOC105165561 [Sesamum indicum]|uniref:Uncharacterized protein LOC105165561 n=1 Tax=Sesamum indicum TaxID=4182 RepID=A0A6I9TP85_SESIN|nr:uncharacterized protein LOC105165561 [Sesamum indicum]XP_011082920.1 uncharacterized protein LOC105165561 [Sesamum indicum]
MDGSKSTVSEAEAETITGSDEGKKDAAESSSVEGKMGEGLGQILEAGTHLDSVVKPYVEEFTEAAKSLLENVTEVGKEVEKLVLVSDPWAPLKKMGTEETLPTSENVGESSEDVKSVSREAAADSKEAEMHSRPFVDVTTATQASWMNCCGLLDVLRPSDQ